MRYLVTGGAGFIGSNFIRFLFNKYGDDASVVNLDKLTYAGIRENLAEYEGKKNYRFVQGDIAKPEEVAEAYKGVDGSGVDVVVNFTGGDTWVPSLRCLKRGGKLLVCGATAGYDPKEDLRYIWSFELQVIGSNSFYDENLQALMGLIVEGKMKPVIDEVLPLERAMEGLRLIENREVFGKVVVTP